MLQVCDGDLQHFDGIGAAVAVRDLDGEAVPATIARLVVEALRRDGVL